MVAHTVTLRSVRHAHSSSALELLKGKQLVSVCFVLDYITFQFDDLVLSALSDPVLIDSCQSWTRASPGYHEALCRNIGACVDAVMDDPRELRIQLESSTLVLPLDAPAPQGPELATLSGHGTFYQAWLRMDSDPSRSNPRV